MRAADGVTPHLRERALRKTDQYSDQPFHSGSGACGSERSCVREFGQLTFGLD